MFHCPSGAMVANVRKYFLDRPVAPAGLFVPTFRIDAFGRHVVGAMCSAA
jgi:hypothetical protein